jgi:hypothetical protein
MFNLAALLISILPHLPDLIGEVEDEINNIAHGEGGAAKIAKVAAGASVLLTTLGTAAAAATVVPAK